tara:strand:+ start:167 stop:385 length:219 start_codon:yes stop_codon:yes gene_type:complete
MNKVYERMMLSLIEDLDPNSKEPKPKPKTQVKKGKGHKILGDIFNHMNLGDLQQELDKLTSVPKKPRGNGNS